MQTRMGASSVVVPNVFVKRPIQILVIRAGTSSLGTTALNSAVAAPGQILGAAALPKAAAAFAAGKLRAGLKAGFSKLTESKETPKGGKKNSTNRTKKEAYQHRRAEEAQTKQKTPPKPTTK